MNKFNWSKAIGYGLAIWLIMFVLMLFASGMSIYQSEWTQLILAGLTGIIGYFFASAIEQASEGQAIGYGTIWAGMGLLLDLLASSIVKTPAFFGFWEYWLGYALLLFAPWVQLQMRSPGTRLEAR